MTNPVADLPRDPFMLMSWVNMKLRDQYSSFDELCDDLQIDPEIILTTLGSIGMEYSKEANKFW